MPIARWVHNLSRGCVACPSHERLGLAWKVMPLIVCTATRRVVLGAHPVVVRASSALDSQGSPLRKCPVPSLRTPPLTALQGTPRPPRRGPRLTIGATRLSTEVDTMVVYRMRTRRPTNPHVDESETARTVTGIPPEAHLAAVMLRPSRADTLVPNHNASRTAPTPSPDSGEAIREHCDSQRRHSDTGHSALNL